VWAQNRHKIQGIGAPTVSKGEGRYALLHGRFTADEAAEVRKIAAGEGKSVSAFVRESVLDVVAVKKVNAQNDIRAARQAQHLHRLPPHLARRLLENDVPPERWPSPDYPDVA
jgi:hypothetical protein